jgi:hypothetical protein
MYLRVIGTAREWKDPQAGLGRKQGEKWEKRKGDVA